MAAGSVAQPQAQSQGQDQGNGQDPLQDWRQFAQMGNSLAQKYPEATESMVKILREIQQIMTKVAGNPQRTAPTQAPPNG